MHSVEQTSQSLFREWQQSHALHFGFTCNEVVSAVLQFIGVCPAGKYVEIGDTIKGFKGIMEGKHDDLPEMAFYMVGDIKEVQEKADKMAKDMAEGNK